MRGEVHNAERLILDKFVPLLIEDVVAWSKDNIDFSMSVESERQKIDYAFSPFLIDPIRQWNFCGKKREVTVVAPEQTGKTLCWLVGLIWTFMFKPCLSLVVYKSDDYAEKINSQKMKPLLKMIPDLDRELSMPRSTRKDHYNFSTLKSYFMGSGSRISSMSSKVCVADELDDWEEHEGYASNLDDLRKRQRSFVESMLYKVCSVRSGGDLGDSQIWEEFEASSMGYWTLRCPKCKELTIRSCDTYHLQFESDDDHQVVPGSCVLICPKCGYKSREDKRERMNQRGGYIHERPERLDERPGFQWGALASMAPDFKFDKIAQAQLDAGSSGSLKKQILFDNSFRGLPFKARRRAGKHEDILKSHIVEPPAEFRYVLLAVDTQDDRFYYVVRGVDDKNNSFLLAQGEAKRVEDLEKIWETKFHGLMIEMAIIDSGGHRARDVGELIVDKPGFWAYKGRGQLAYRRWERSKESKKLILANPTVYQSELLYAMYGAENKGSNYWFLTEAIDDEYFNQMLDFKPDNKKRGGQKYANWVSSGKDHLFDCEKMLLLLNEMYRHFKLKLQKRR